MIDITCCLFSPPKEDIGGQIDVVNAGLISFLYRKRPSYIISFNTYSKALLLRFYYEFMLFSTAKLYAIKSSFLVFFELSHRYSARVSIIWER